MTECGCIPTRFCHYVTGFNYVVYILFLFASLHRGHVTAAAPCPTSCFCNAPSRIVYCSRRGLTAVPEGVASDSLQLNLNGNVFHSTTLRRGNFSGMVSLEHLYLSECGVERIEVGTFSDLSHLRWLDLSNNRIRVLAERQFAGLSLQHLFLNGNRHVDIKATSFDGLVTTGLYLHDCSLSSVAVDIFSPLNTSLKNLWLNGNELTSIQIGHRALFAGLTHLRLGSNPLHCNCETSWLKELYDSAPDVFRGSAAPSCLTPNRLRGRHFNDVSSNDFRCQAPAFSNIETAFGADVGGAKLRCTATGDPAPTLYWIQPSGKTTRYGPPLDEESRRNEGLLVVRETLTSEADPTASSVFGMYICVANNEAGNVTLTINVSWPFAPPSTLFRPASLNNTSSRSTTSQSAHRVFTSAIPSAVESSPAPLLNVPTHPQRTTHRPDKSSSVVLVTTESSRHRVGGDVANYTVLHNVDGRPSSVEEHPEHPRQGLFTVTELVCAVIGTHIGTLLVCLVVLPLVYRRRQLLAARDKRDRSVVVAGLGVSPPAYGTTTTTNSAAASGPISGVGVRRVGGSSNGVGLDQPADCKPLYSQYPQNTLPTLPTETVYLNGTSYTTAQRQQRQQLLYQQQQQNSLQHHFLTDYLLTSQRR